MTSSTPDQPGEILTPVWRLGLTEHFERTFGKLSRISNFLKCGKIVIGYGRFIAPRFPPANRCENLFFGQRLLLQTADIVIPTIAFFDGCSQRRGIVADIRF